LTTILHLAPAEYYRSFAADQPYLPQDFEQDGFIHCTKGAALMLEVANTFYKEIAGEFVVLLIDADKVMAPLRFEPAMPVNDAQVDASEQVLFPHIYGPINRDAIIDVVEVHRESDGAFAEFVRTLDESQGTRARSGASA
jgi:uncharacterized protein (DUF952 family)